MAEGADRGPEILDHLFGDLEANIHLLIVADEPVQLGDVVLDIDEAPGIRGDAEVILGFLLGRRLDFAFEHALLRVEDRFEKQRVGGQA